MKTREEILRSAGFEPDPVIEAFKKDVDRTLIRENLKLTVEQRIEQLMGLMRFAHEIRGTACRKRTSS